MEQPDNLFYLTGLELSAGCLIVTADAAEAWVDGRYIEAASNRPGFTARLNSSPADFNVLEASIAKGVTGLCKSTTTLSQYENWQRQAGTKFTLSPCEDFVLRQRMIKYETEAEALRQAAILGSAGLDYLLTQIRPGVSEKELAQKLQIFWLERGATKPSFEPIIAFNENGSRPHYRASDTRLTPNSSILIDIGCVLNHYCSDMTRMVFLGKPHPEVTKITKICEEAQKAALALARPGAAVYDLDQAARKIIGAAGYGENFSHSLGHGVGIEIHELPQLPRAKTATILEPGMVITIEPGIYLPGIGGVRIEDTILITKDGHENFTKRPCLFQM